MPKLFDHGRCYIFQAADGRIVFAIPFEADFTLIGTTDRDYEGDPAEAAASAEEIAYLCGAASEYFIRPVRPADVVWTYSGVRPLYDDGASDAQAVTRDYVLVLDTADGVPPLRSVVGGKIPTFRRLAGTALDKLAPHLVKKGIQMEQVLVNVVKNALEAIGRDGAITVKVARPNGRLQVAIEDTGPGLSPEARAKLFTPFFTTKAEGQGIGLTLVREVLAQHRFDYALDSPPGGSTRFSILM